MGAIMLQRQTSADGIVFYASPLLLKVGVPHAFSTRIGGISGPPFDSMNLGNPNGCAVQDDYENVWANYRRLQAAAGCGGRELCRVHQVHGAGVVRARAGQPFDTSARADAIVGDDPGRVLSVRVADCVPVLLATDDGRAVAAVHAGWRGVIAGVVTATMDELLDVWGSTRNHAAGATRPAVFAAIGPCIGGEAFEVGPEVLAECTPLKGGEHGRIRGGGDKVTPKGEKPGGSNMTGRAAIRGLVAAR